MQALPPRIDIREVGMRDGLQLEPPLPLDSKLRLLEAIVGTGVCRIEVTSFVSPRAVPALADADALACHLDRWPGVQFSAVVLNTKGAQRALDAGINHLEFVVSAAEGHSRANAGRSTREAAADLPGVAGLITKAGGRLELVIATAWDCPFDGPTPESRVLALADLGQSVGADEVCLADTIGTVTPGRLTALIRAVRDHAGTTPAVHLHDTRGSGQVNAMAALTAGVARLDASIGGLGGCPFAPGASGNIATEELVYWTEASGVTTGLELASVLDAAALAQQLLGHPLRSSLLRAGLPSPVLEAG
jgi:hydroxymethylglutaryl-CoA lyase